MSRLLLLVISISISIFISCSQVVRAACVPLLNPCNSCVAAGAYEFARLHSTLLMPLFWASTCVQDSRPYLGDLRCSARHILNQLSIRPLIDFLMRFCS